MPLTPGAVGLVSIPVVAFLRLLHEENRIGGNRQDLLLVLSVTPLRFIHVVPCLHSWSLSVLGSVHCTLIPLCVSIYSLKDTVCLQFLAILSITTVRIHVQVFV